MLISRLAGSVSALCCSTMLSAAMSNSFCRSQSGVISVAGCSFGFMCMSICMSSMFMISPFLDIIFQYRSLFLVRHAKNTAGCFIVCDF